MSDQFKLSFPTATKYGTFKRYMWRWDGIGSGTVFQMARINIGNVPRPYTLVSYYCSKGTVANNSTQGPDALLSSETPGQAPKYKWCQVDVNSTAFGWIIFDLDNEATPEEYSLIIGEDTASSPGRNPKRVRLYGTNDLTAKTFDNISWVLLSDFNGTLPTTNLDTWTTTINKIPEKDTFLTFQNWTGYVTVTPPDPPLANTTVLWTGTTASVTGDNQLTQSITYNDNIGNYDFVDVYYWCGRDGQCCRRIPVINSAFNCGVMWPEHHATGNYNWFKMCMSGVGTTGYKRGGHARTTNLGNYTSYAGGMWSQGQFYKVVGIKEI